MTVKNINTNLSHTLSLKPTEPKFADYLKLLSELSVVDNKLAASDELLENLRKTGREAAISLAHSLQGLGRLPGAADDDSNAIPLGFIAGFIGEAIETIFEIEGFLTHRARFENWPFSDTAETKQPAIQTLLWTLPYFPSEPNEQASPQLVNLENTLACFADTEQCNLRRFSSLLENPTALIELGDKLPNALRVASEWAGMLDVLLFLLTDARYVLESSKKAA